jgi:hypothetical protein
LSIPTHTIACITKSFPTHCPECNADVWFFSCTCGSKVYFNELGYPWEQHQCRKYFLQQELSLIKNAGRLSDEEVYRMISELEKKKGHTVDDQTLEILESILGKRRTPFTTFTIIADIASEFAGQVMEINNPVNIFKKLGYDASSVMSVKLLGKAGSIVWAVATIRTNPDKRNAAGEYEVFIPADYLRSKPLQKGQFVAGLLDVLVHPKGKVWRIQEHKVV